MGELPRTVMRFYQNPFTTSSTAVQIQPQESNPFTSQPDRRSRVLIGNVVVSSAKERKTLNAEKKNWLEMEMGMAFLPLAAIPALSQKKELITPKTPHQL